MREREASLDNEVKVADRVITANLSNGEEALLRNRNRVSAVEYRVVDFGGLQHALESGPVQLIECVRCNPADHPVDHQLARTWQNVL